VNTVIKGVQKLIDAITRKKRFTKNDEFRFNQVLEAIRTDDEVRESVFVSNYVVFNAKKRHLIARLREAYNNPDKHRHNSLVEYHGAERRA
jgi:RNase P protein component